MKFKFLEHKADAKFQAFGKSLRNYLLTGIFGLSVFIGTRFLTKPKEFQFFKTYSSLTIEFIYKGGLSELIKGKKHTHDWIKKNIPNVEERLDKIQTEKEYHKIWDKFWDYF